MFDTSNKLLNSYKCNRINENSNSLSGFDLFAVSYENMLQLYVDLQIINNNLNGQSDYYSLEGFIGNRVNFEYDKAKREINLYKINIWLYNLINDTSLGLSKQRKDAMLAAARELINKEYELAFIAGVLGNIKNEGDIGLFESSSYSSNKPDYLEYMDTYYNYRAEYSRQNIVDKKLSIVYNMILELEPNSWRDPVTDSRRGFGLGSVQWTFSRCKRLVENYIKVANGSDSISIEQATEAESMTIVQELEEDSDYKPIYPDWLKDNEGILYSDIAAYNAGYDVTIRYERPTDGTIKAPKRAEDAQEIFNVMKN